MAPGELPVYGEEPPFNPGGELPYPSPGEEPLLYRPATGPVPEPMVPASPAPAPAPPPAAPPTAARPGAGAPRLPSTWGELLETWTRTFVPPVSGPLPEPPSFTPPAPSYAPFVAPAFTPPSPESVYADPSYAFRLGQGLQALEHSAAARGTLLTGATGRALQEYGQQFASQEYQNIFNRALQAFQTNLEAALRQANLSREDYDRAFRSALAAFTPAFQAWQTTYAGAQRKEELDYERAWREYLQSYNIWAAEKQRRAGLLQWPISVGLSTE